MTNRYLANRLFRIGLFLVLIGWTPLWGIVLLAAIGLWPDPNPNPIGPGLLFFFTAWPAIICLAIGFFQVRRGPRSPDVSTTARGRARRRL